MLFSVFFFAAASNLDNLVVGLSYGLRKIQINPLSNLLVASLTFLGTVAAMWAGRGASSFLSISAARGIGSLILVLLGLIALAKYYRDAKGKTVPQEGAWPVKNPEKFDGNRNQKIEWHEALVLGLALSLNNMGMGIGAGILGLGILPTASAAFFFSYLFLFAGNFLGSSCVSKLLETRADLVSGLLILFFGLWELVT